jgi:hypothetical protein
MTDAGMAMPTRHIDMWYAGTAPQRRLTVAFRIILAIPQFIVLYFLGIATLFVVVIGWFAALFMGRLPEWAHSFISGVVRWYTRVGAYMFLLTDRYPPFSLDDEAYPARPILPARGRLNRWAVLFRIILAIPAGAFYQIVEYGLTIPLLLVMWFVVLISGRMPPSLYATYSALLRYQVRFHAYFLMLTSEYAWGMLGDRVAPQPPTFAAPPFAAPPASTPTGAPPYAPGYPTPPAPPFSYPSVPTETTGTTGDQATTADRPDAAQSVPAPQDAEVPESGAAAPAPPPEWPPPLPPPPMSSPPTAIGAMPPPSPWERVAPSPPTGDETPGWGTLVLTGAARGWMIFAIVWGSILFLGQNIAQNIVVGHRQSSVQQFNTVNSDTSAANTAIDKAVQSIKSCTAVACLGPSYTAAAAKLTQLADDLHGMSLPSNAGGQAQNVESDANQLASVFTKLANSSDAATYRATAQSSNLGSILSSYTTDSQSLLNTLNSDLS